MRTRVLPLAFALLLAACGGATGGTGTTPAAAGSQAPVAGTAAPVASTGSGGTAIDPCSLLTVDEVQAKAGDTVTKTEKTDRTCTWWLGKDQTSWIGLAVWRNGKLTFDAIASGPGQAVAGLGEKAFADGSTLIALKGDTMLQLSSEIVLSPADPAAFNQPLMEIALGRL
jgi:hypothetical protein